VGGLKPYIQKELKMHDIANVEAARRKEKAIEAKFHTSKHTKGSHIHRETSRRFQRPIQTNTFPHLEGKTGRTSKIKE